MSLGNQIAWDDTVLPFQLDRADTRGRVARLDGVLNQILAQHNYPPQIEALICEAVLITALIGQTIKLRWKLSLQIRGNGGARIIATDYYSPANQGDPAQIRAYASFDQERLDAVQNPFDLIGNGYFAVIIDQGEGSEPYQGITPLDGGSLTACAENYFKHSEQLPTRFTLSFGQSQLPGQPKGWRGGGMMIQHMPESSPFATGPDESGGSDPISKQISEPDNDSWNRVNMLLDTVEDLELVGPTVPPTDLLVRLFSAENPRVFDSQPVAFGCTCSPERVRQSLSIYSKKDIAHMTTGDGRVTADCQFCGAHYDFDPATLGFQAKESTGGTG